MAPPVLNKPAPVYQRQNIFKTVIRRAPSRITQSSGMPVYQQQGTVTPLAFSSIPRNSPSYIAPYAS
jgi:hypothetical protein